MHSRIISTPKILLNIFLCLACVFLPVRHGFAQSLGRIFYTPQQRLQLEQLRSQSDPSDAATDSHSAAGDTIRYNGLVRRSGGRTTAWINGQRLDQAAEEFNDLNLYLRGSNLVVDGGNRRVIVGPGEAHRIREDTMPETTESAATGTSSN